MKTRPFHDRWVAVTLSIGLFSALFPSGADAAKCKSAVLKNRDAIVDPIERNDDHWFGLFGETGFSDIQAYRKAIAAQPAPNLKRVAKQLQNEKFEVAILVPVEKRAEIFKGGFKNFHETKSSSMEATLKLRTAVEASMLGMTVADYRKIPVAKRPKYGLAASDLADLEKIVRQVHVRPFGSEAYLFDLKAVRDALTITPGDSLNRAGRHASRTIQVGYSNGLTIMEEGRAVKLDGWDLHFIPWENRDLLAPYLYRKDSKQSPFIPIDDGYECPDGLHGFYGLTGEKNIVPGFKVAMPEPRSQYVEIQFWHEKLSLNHVKGYVFFEFPPTKVEYTRLKALGIEVYDGRKARKKPVEFRPKSDAAFTPEGDFITDFPKKYRYN